MESITNIINKNKRKHNETEKTKFLSCENRNILKLKTLVAKEISRKSRNIRKKE